MANFEKGQKFCSFSEFENCLTNFENENFVKYFKRNSRKIETAVRSGKIQFKINPDLIYYEVQYSCVRGGAFRMQGTGKRKTRSCKIECSAHISLRATSDGKSLEVKSFSNTHNHEISKFLINIRKRKSGSGADKDGPKRMYFNMLHFLKDKTKPQNWIEAGLEDSQMSQDGTHQNAEVPADGSGVTEESIQAEPVPTAKSRKPNKKSNNVQMAEDAYNVMKKLSVNLDDKPQDEFDAFGVHVACQIRNLQSKVDQATAKYRINHILYKLEMNQLLGSSVSSDDRPNACSTPCISRTPVEPHLTEESIHIHQVEDMNIIFGNL